MNVTFKIPLHKEWVLVDDKIIIGGEEILLEEITDVKLISKGGIGINGVFQLTIRNKKVITLGYPPKFKNEGYEAYVYIKENFGTEEDKVIRKSISGIDVEQSVFSDIKSKIKKTKEEEKVVRCPKCKGAQITAHKKGFGLGKAVVGTVTFGLLAGAGFGAVGKNKIYLSCMHCGHQWKPKR